MIPTISFLCASIFITVVWTQLFLNMENNFKNYTFFWLSSLLWKGLYSWIMEAPIMSWQITVESLSGNKPLGLYTKQYNTWYKHWKISYVHIFKKCCLANHGPIWSIYKNINRKKQAVTGMLCKFPRGTVSLWWGMCILSVCVYLNQCR